MTTDLIEPTIDHSLTIAHSRAPTGDVAHGLLAALRRVRWVVDEVGGYTMVSMLDGAIRDRLLVRGLRNIRAGAAELPARLPMPGAHSAAAEAILVSAADACMVYAAQKTDISDLLFTVLVLLDRLTETLHSAPPYAALMDWLRVEADVTVSEDSEPMGARPSFLH